MLPAEYHSDPANSSSGLKIFCGDPPKAGRQAYRRICVDRTEQWPVTRVMEMGTLIDAMVQCPMDFDPVAVMYTGECAPMFHAMRSLASPPTTAELGRVESMRQALLAHQWARWLLWEAPGESQHVIKWHDEACGLDRRAMLDRLLEPAEWNNDTLMIVDLKMVENEKLTKAGEPLRNLKTLREALRSSAYRLDYFHQIEYYRDAVQAERDVRPPGLIVAVDSIPDPDTGRHEVGVFDVTEHPKARWRQLRAAEENRAALVALAQCHQTGDWSDPPPEPEPDAKEICEL